MQEISNISSRGGALLSYSKIFIENPTILWTQSSYVAMSMVENRIDIDFYFCILLGNSGKLKRNVFKYPSKQFKEGEVMTCKGNFRPFIYVSMSSYCYWGFHLYVSNKLKFMRRFFMWIIVDNKTRSFI